MANRKAIALGIAVFLASLGARAAEESRIPLGRLAAEAEITIHSETGAISIQDTSLPYFAGDTVATAADAKAVFTLPAGTIVLGPDGRARITGGPDGFRIELEQAWIQVRLAPAARFEIAVDGLRLRPMRSARTPEAGTEAFVARQETGHVVVHGDVGALRALARGDDAGVTLVAGVSHVFDGKTGRPVGDVAAREAALLDLLRNPALQAAGVAALGGAGYGIYEAVNSGSGDGDDDADPASPVD